MAENLQVYDYLEFLKAIINQFLKAITNHEVIYKFSQGLLQQINPIKELRKEENQKFQ